MRLDYAFFADSAAIPQDGKVYVLGGGFSQLTLAQLPGRYAFAVVAGFRFDSSDVGHTHQVELRFVDADGKLVIPPSNLQFQAGGTPPVEDREWSVPTVTFISPMFGDAGNFAAEYWQGERMLARIGLRVEAQAPGAEGPRPN